jgi:hypothetical protein
MRRKILILTAIAMTSLSACGNHIATGSTGDAAAPGSVTTAGPMTLTELAVKMKAGSMLTSAHFTLAAKIGNTKILTAKGDETLADGKLTAMRLNQRVGTVAVGRRSTACYVILLRTS